MPAGGITGGGNLAFAQRMPGANDTDETIAEQSLGPHLRTRRLAHHAGFEIDGPVAKRRTVFVELLHEAQAHAGSFPGEASNEVRSEVLHKAFAGAQRERADQVFEIELLRRAQHRFCVLHQLTDPSAEFERSRGGDQAASAPDQQRVAGGTRAIAPGPGSSPMS